VKAAAQAVKPIDLTPGHSDRNNLPGVFANCGVAGYPGEEARSMLKRVVLAVFVAALAILAFISTRESTYSVSRSTTIAAPAEVVFGMVNNLGEWVEWSPWDSLDPAMKKTFVGPSSGVGASYAWSGNSDVGKGKMTIIESRPPTEVSYRLEFEEPWASVSNPGFTIEKEGDGVYVTWTLTGEHRFLGKAMSLFVDLDQAIGPDFERGLVALKARSETEAKRLAEETARQAETKAPAEESATDDGE
jgi:hypothetical protein